MADPDVIVLAAANGMSVTDIARSHGLTEIQVQTVITQEAARCMEGEHMRREWMLEARRLRALGMKYYELGMQGDPTAAMVFLRASERLSTLSGLNHPIGYSVNLINSSPPVSDEGTSTDRIERVLARICGEL